jgi:hypothetical protein
LVADSPDLDSWFVSSIRELPSPHDPPVQTRTVLIYNQASKFGCLHNGTTKFGGFGGMKNVFWRLNSKQ